MVVYSPPSAYPYADQDATRYVDAAAMNLIVQALADLLGSGGRVVALESAVGGGGGGSSYTDENAQDAVAAALAAGTHTGLTATYDDAGNRLSLAVTITQYTDEQARDAAGAALAAGVHSGITATPNDAADRIDLAVTPQGISVPTPADTGLKAWSIDPALANSNQTLPSAGVAYLFKVRLDQAATITGACLNVSAAGATVANGYVGLYDASGNRVAVSAAISTAWQSTGYVPTPFTSTYAAAAGVYYVAVLVGSAGTLPGFSRQVQGSAIVNGLATATTGFRFGASGTGQTALPSTITMSAVTAAQISYHVGLY